MCTTNQLLKEIKELRKTKFYKQANPVVKNLLTEVEELIHDEKIAVNRSRKQNGVTRLFEIQFSDFKPIIIHTIWKSGAERVKCYENCIGDKSRETIEQIKTVCGMLNWNVETDRVGGKCIHHMKIGCFIQEKATP